MDRLRKFDLHPKTRKSSNAHRFGRHPSIFSTISIVYLVAAELRYARQVRVMTHCTTRRTARAST